MPAVLITYRPLPLPFLLLDQLQGLDIIAIGASAGGVPALQHVAKNLPRNLNAAVFVVLHLPPWHESHLASILDRAGPLPAAHAKARQKVEPGRIYVAPPNLHLILDDHHMDLWQGPKENQHRPAINTLFRSAAVVYGPRVAGVVLSGNLDDGSAGLWWIKRYGGTTIVQDPETALFPAMPQNALAYVDVDYVVALENIPGLLTRLASGEEEPPGAETAANRRAWSPSESK
jgi:two-component system chemotaxis response regulator CheB